MRKDRNNAGFSLGELLVVVAILVILMGLAFVALFQHQRTLTQLELDGAAKEIFVAAQNHLTLAESQGLIESNPNKGTEETGDNDVRYFVVGAVTSYPGNNDDVLSLMLPFASVDDTIRLGGSYVISYEVSSGRVLDVFYAEKSGRYSHTFFAEGETFDSLKAVRDTETENNREERRNYRGGKSVIGWYGGNGLSQGTPLKKPTIQIVNAERLVVKVTNPNTSSAGYDPIQLQLIMEGMSSHKTHIFKLLGKEADTRLKKTLESDSDFTIVLDDITESGRQFSKQFTDFLPGENISLYVEACYVVPTEEGVETKLGITRSITKQTNSLFATMEEVAETEGSNFVGTRTVGITNIRHLENLDKDLSGYYNTGKIFPNDGSSLEKTAIQNNDLSWLDFVKKIATQKGVAEDSIKVVGTSTDGRYLPINPVESVTYDGQENSILDLQINHTGPAGVFGTLTNSTIQNVAVRNTLENDSGLLIKGTGDTGGLVGVMNGGTIEQCAAAVRVESASGNAGGLIGTSTSGTISASYSGGHTYQGGYYDAESHPIYNVKSTSGSAGGLVGNAGTTMIDYSYSTCSVSGTTAGGLAGTASGEIKTCYCTGLVEGTTKGAFLGSQTDGSTDGCYYFESINKVPDPMDSKKTTYLANVGQTNVSTDDIKPVDSDTQTYTDFFKQSPQRAIPYDNTLTKNYGGKYPLKTILGLDPAATGLIATTHYGDWPKPAWEVFFVNEPA